MEKEIKNFNKNEGEQLVMTVTQYNYYINKLASIQSVLVMGEVSNFRKIPGRSFCYFDIKDQSAVAKCFLLFSYLDSLVEIENGTNVKIFGFPSLQKNGSFVINVRDINIIGEGALLKAYQKLKSKLEKEGLFDSERKKALPRFPLKVGLIAGKNSSAYHDVVSEVKERWSETKIFFLPVRVQGVLAKKQIVRAIRYFNQKCSVDVLIIARGGGSAEDLQAFDIEEVVREIASSRIPIISAIGHEDHWTLSDFVSDARAKTPTKAAQLAVPDRKEIKEELDYLLQRAQILVKHQLEERFSKIENVEKDLKFYLVNRFKNELEKVENGLVSRKEKIKNQLEIKRKELSLFQKAINLANPEAILKMGYAILEKKGKRIKSTMEIKEDDEIKAVLRDGKLEAIVKNVRRKSIVSLKKYIR